MRGVRPATRQREEWYPQLMRILELMPDDFATIEMGRIHLSLWHRSHLFIIRTAQA